MASRGSCYICGHTSRSLSTEGLSFHMVPRKTTRRQFSNKWMEFLHLPPISEWPNDKWRDIRLCSRHFTENDLSNCKDYLRKLVNNAIPTLNRPSGCGRFGKLFSDRKIFCRETSENSLQCPQSPIKTEGPFTSKLDDSTCEKLETEEDVWQNGQYYSELTFLDYDYVGTVNTNGQQKYEGPKNKKEALCSQLMVQDVRKELCRLCGQKGTLLKPIFESSSETDMDVSLSTKIDMYLPFKIKVDDPLPSHICSQCFDVLDRWHELYVTSVAADAMLWKTFGGESDMYQKSPEPLTSSRDEDSDNQCAVLSDPVVEAECDKESTIVEAGNSGDCADVLNESEEELEVLCTVCGMNTSSRPSKEEDLFIKEFRRFYAGYNTTRFKCFFCYEFFTHSHAKVEHVKNCRELSAICEICGRNDIRRKDLRKHKYRHQQVIFTHTCDRCGKCYKSLSALNRHIYHVHGRGLIPKFCCHLCCSAFVHEQNYQVHQRKHEKGIIKTVFRIEEYLECEGVYICPICKKTFNDSLSFVIHLTSKRDLKCTLCHKLMTSEKNFILHVCGDWKCRYCTKISKTKMKWLEHERLHSGEKPLKCRVCDKSFRSYQLRACHESTHAPAYQCSTCNKKFRNKYIFRDHVECHEGRIFSCPVCQKEFSGRSRIKRHMNAFHKGITAKIE